MASDAIALPSNGIAKMCTMGWLESLCLWDELTEAGASAEGAMASIKMEDYTRKVIYPCNSNIRQIEGGVAGVFLRFIHSGRSVFQIFSASSFGNDLDYTRKEKSATTSVLLPCITARSK